MAPLDVILIVVAAVCAAYVLVLCGLHGARQARRVGTYMRDAAAAPFTTHFNDADREHRRRQLGEEVRRALGLDEADDARERADVVEAAVAAQQISVLNQKLRKTVHQCLQVHWSVARGLGAIDMAEAAHHPLSQRLRQRVIDLSELLSDHLAHYPLLLDAPELIRLQLGLRWVAPTCITCPYRTATVADAPRICPTARAMGHGRAPGAHGSGVVEGEIIDPCAEERL